MIKRVRVLFTALGMLVILQSQVMAQFTLQHQPPTVIVKGEATVFEFLAAGITQEQVQEAIFFTRLDGELSFSQKEATLRNGVFTVSHTVSNVNANTLEYYFLVRLVNGQELSFPQNNFAEAPVEVPLVGTSTERVKYEKLTGVDFTVLSPDPGLAFAKEDLVVAIALFYDPAAIEPGEFRIVLDGEDVTSDADTSAYFLSYIPEKIRLGNHDISIEYVDNDGNRYSLTSWEFSVVDPSSASFSGFGGPTVPVGSLELTARNQVIAGDVNDALTGRVRVSGNQGYLNYSINGFLTSQESSRLQPQNRFGANLNYGKWFKFQAGHIFPTLSNLSLAGRRVYGINSSLHLINEGFNVQFVYGQLNRKVTNQYSRLDRGVIQLDDGTVVDTTYAISFEDGGRGTFEREIIGGRVAFGNPRKFQFGIQALKIEDDTTSLDRITNFDDLLSFRRDLSSTLDVADIAKLTNQPELLTVNGGNPNPAGNIVAGTDLKMRFDKSRIQFDGEVSAGLLNDDITGGALTVQRADDLGFDISEDDADLLDRISRFIIINENLRNLPLRIDENDDTEFFFPTAVLAGNGLTSFNYGKNNLRVQYRWIGPDYNSLANSTIRRDVAGITITDRLRLASNRVYLTLGYESLDDNVVGNKDATTNTQTVRTNLSWYPIKRSLPRVTVGVRLRDRGNSVDRFNAFVPNNLRNAAVQNFQIVNGDTLGAPVSRSNNTVSFNGSITQQFQALDMRHDASLNINTLKTTDDVFVFGDTRSTSFSFNINSRFNTVPFNTNIGFSVNNTETTSGLSEFNIFGLYAGGTYFLMSNRLSINGQVAITNNTTNILPIVINDNGTTTGVDDFFEADNPLTRTRDEFSTYVLRTGLQFDINAYQALLFDANFTNISGRDVPSDRIVQLRYILKF